MSMTTSSSMFAGPDGLVVGNFSGPSESDVVRCDCCGLTEECTLSYIETIRKRYGGKWICGLCAEAVKYEALRSRTAALSADEAMARHLSFCSEFRATCPPRDPTTHLIRAMSQLLRKGLESPKSIRSTPSSPIINGRRSSSAMARSESCMPSLTLVDTAAYGGDEGGLD